MNAYKSAKTLWHYIFCQIGAFNLNAEIETTDSADFTDFEEVIGDERTNLFVAKLHRVDNRNPLYPCNLRNLRLNPFRFLGLKIVTRPRSPPHWLWNQRYNI